jgi:hypothetical protein
VPPDVVITTFFAPTVPTGVVITICVSELLLIVAVVPPTVTEVAPERLVPVIVTEVPPDAEPEVGIRFVYVGEEAKGVIELEGEDDVPVPTLFVAEIVNVYACPCTKLPVTANGVDVPE